MRRAWSASEVIALTGMYPDMHTGDIAALLERTVSQVYNAAFTHGLKKSVAYMASQASGRATDANQNPGMIASRFKAGFTPWNAGMKGWSAAGTVATRFVRGNRPKTWVPVGTEKLNKDGCLVRKVSDTRVRTQDWKTVHSIVWASVRGEIPAGHIVVFKTGKRTSSADLITVDRLDCLSRSELMQRNSYHLNYPPVS